MSMMGIGTVLGQPFTDVTEEAGFIQRGYSYSASFGDFDNDGWLDLVVANGGGEDYIYRNLGDGTFAVIEGIGAPTASSTYGRWFDLNGDGFLDLVTAALGGRPVEILYDPVTGLSPSSTSILPSEGAASRRISPADFDGDGDLDLFVTQRQDKNNLLFRRDGPDTFSKVTDVIIAADGGDSTCSEWADVDDDGDLDLLVCNTGDPNSLYENLGGGKFEKRNGTPISSRSDRTSSGSWGDFDGDGDLDLYVGNSDEPNQHFENLGDWVFRELQRGPHTEFVGNSIGTTALDVDNDGDLDLFASNLNGRNALFFNDGTGRFDSPVQFSLTASAGPHAAHTWGDYDRDGDLDVFVAALDPDESPQNRLFRNDLQGPDTGWLHLRLKGPNGNPTSVGAQVHALLPPSAGGAWMRRDLAGGQGGMTSGDEVAFGLGTASSVDSLIIRWPSGAVDAVGKVDGNRLIEIPEPRVEASASAVPAPEGTLVEVEVTDETRSLARVLVAHRTTSNDAYSWKEASLQGVDWLTSTYRATVSSTGTLQYYVIVEFDHFQRSLGTPDNPLAPLQTGLHDGVVLEAPDLDLPYPLPAFSEVYVPLSIPVHGQSRLTLYDSLGRKLRDVAVPANRGRQVISLGMDDLAPGVYFVSLHTEGRLAGTRSIVKSN